MFKTVEQNIFLSFVEIYENLKYLKVEKSLGVSGWVGG
jgi:hypothetical protein